METVLKELSTALILADVNIRLVSQLRKNVKQACNFDDLQNSGANKTRIIRKAIFDELVTMLTPDVDNFKPKKGRSNVFMFVGLQGSGKTTTIAKFGSYYKRKGWKVCFVCCDTFRAGAFDQIKQNAIKLNIPYYGNAFESDPVRIASDGVEQFRKDKYDIILVDTSGRHKQEDALFDEMQQVQEVTDPDEVVFVMDSTAGQQILEQAQAFKRAVPVGSVVITKLDGNAKGGGALSAVTATNSPISFIGTGEHFDEFEQFEAQSFVSRLLGMGDIKGLINTFKEKSDIFDKAPELMERMQKGKFTLRDMQSQFGSVLKMGNMSQLMSMVPGMSQMMSSMGGGSGKDASKKLQMFMTCMDSMTDGELDGIFTTKKWSVKDKKHIVVTEKYFNESRIRRIALGSGTSIMIVKTLLQYHKQFEKMVGKMGKSGLMNKGDSGFNQKLQRNPQALMQKLQQSMDPKMLKQMGGAQSMLDMMKQMGGLDESTLKGMTGGLGLGGLKKGRRR